MTTVLGASIITIGIIEAAAETAAAIAKVFSGVVSDYLRKRKILVVLGYALAAITKPVFPHATTIGWVFAARFVDRIVKASVEHHAMRWSPTSYRRRCEVPPTACASRLIR